MSSHQPTPSLDLARQTSYFLRSTSILPQPYTSGDANMLSLAFFILAGLDLLGLLDPSDERDSSDADAADAAATTNATHSKRISPAQKQGWIRWIYSFQAPLPGGGGFRGSRFWDLGDEGPLLWEKGWDRASLANTFMGLLMLLMLGDDLGRLRKDELARWVRGLQSERGGFAEELPGEKGGVQRKMKKQKKQAEELKRDDMRMCYCAAGIACILGPGYECVDVARLRRFVVNAQAYEGGVGQTWAMEGHSGLNYCAVGCLTLLDRLEQEGQGLPKGEGDSELQINRLIEHGFEVLECANYMLMRQTSWIEDKDEDEEEEDDDEGEEEEKGFTTDPERQLQDGSTPHEYFGQPLQREAAFIAGFNGRTNKMADTCYCFWNLSALDILGMSDLADHNALRRYLLGKTQHKIGGFSKAPGEYPDLMHSYLGLAALAVMKEEEGLKELDPALCVSVGVWKQIERLHATAAEDREEGKKKR